MQQVYLIFTTSGDNEAYTLFDFKAVASTKARAEAYIQRLEDARLAAHDEHMHVVQAVHDDMGPANNWTHFGSCDGCNAALDCFRFGGYIVETHEVF